MMREPLPFEDDPAADAAAAFDGLVDALSRLRAHEEAGLPAGDNADEVAEMAFRMIDLVSAALDAAGVSDALTRMGAINVFREALADYVSDVAHDELDDPDYEDGEVRDAALTDFIAGRILGSNELAHPLRLPELSFVGRPDPALRN